MLDRIVHMFYSRFHALSLTERAEEVEVCVSFNGLILGQDVVTAACGLLNAGYFAEYAWHGDGTNGRRAGAVALTLVSIAAVIEAIFSQALFWSQREVLSSDILSPGMWALVRVPLLLATVAISSIIIRRLVR